LWILLDKFIVLIYYRFVPTINDVAMECGVSISTVSTVLNNACRPVSATTRQRVLAAATRLNYHPNAMASGLVRRRMNTIGVLPGVFHATEVLTDIWAFGILQGILQSAAEKDFHVTLFTKFWQDSSHSLGAYRDRRTDGIIVIAPSLNSDMLSVLSTLDLLLVTVSAAPQPGIASVDVDNRLGTRLAVEHLLGLGHSRIAHITGDTDQMSVVERRTAFHEIMTERGLGSNGQLVVPANYDGSNVKAATRYLLSLLIPPTAIFAGNDAIGKRVVDAIVSLGLSVPGDISVVGFDDSIYASTMTPQLTTVRQSPSKLGALAASLLIDSINGVDKSAQRHLLTPELIVRNTTTLAAM
jgi:DNA-binding LacI/PurR family transcriptional regulator